MDPQLKSVLSLQQFSVAFAARLTEMNIVISNLKECIRNIDNQNELVLKEISSVISESKCLNKEIDMVLAHNKSIDEQIALFSEVVRPQLLNQLKQSKECTKTKEKEYKEKIQHYEKLWQTYEIAYNKFPRVAERNALLVGLKLMRIQAMMKKQEVVEKCKQADQLQQVKACRLKILQKEVFQCFSTEQNARLNCEELEKKIIEIKARITSKKAKKLEEQKRLEEERKKQQEDERQRQTSQEALDAESAVNKTETTQTLSSSVITIPTFEIPIFDFLETVTTNPSAQLGVFKSPSESRTGASIEPRKIYRQGLGDISLSRLMRPLTSVPLNAYDTNLPSAETSSLTHTGSLQLQDVMCQGNTIQEVFNESELGPGDQQETPVLNSLKLNTTENSKGLKETNSTITKSPSLNSQPQITGTSKRELILSTDNIAAKLKETIQPNIVVSDHTNERKSLKRKATKVLTVGNGIPSSHKDFFSQERYTGGQDSLLDSYGMEQMETDESNKRANVVEAHQKSNNEVNVPEDTSTSDSSVDLVQSHSAENVNSPTEENHAYDFGAEYGDEMYASLPSPPCFESVMSPEHAGFESPVSSFDKTPADAANDLPAFSGFNFFSQASTGIFGGQSDSEKEANEQDKSASSFSFLF